MEKTANAHYDPKPYLKGYGYLRYARGEAEAGASIDEILKLAMRTFQERFGLNISGELDDETEAMMKRPRCGNLDFGDGEDSISLYYSKPDDFDPKKFLEAFGFLGLARAHLFKDRDDGGGDGAAEEEVLELAVKKFQQTYGIRVTGKFEDQEMIERIDFSYTKTSYYLFLVVL